VTAAGDVSAARLARIALGRIAEPGQVALLESVHAHGAEVVREALLHDPDFGPRLRVAEPERDLEEASRRGLRFVIPEDEEWPAPLDDLATADALNRRGGVPLGLWVRGPLPLSALAGSIAVVGSRSSTTYGEDLAREIAAAAAEAGRPVVSGAAYGIDHAAHRGALSAGGTTVAVLACGADRIYPQRSSALLAHLADQGAVISETPPGGAPMKMRFLSRNRIIAALASGTVVVEAALRSGALNTASWAERCHRALMGVPGPVTSASSAGVHQLVRSGAATLVTSGAEVLEQVGAAGEHLVDVPRGPRRVRDGLPPDQLQVLEAVPVGVGAAIGSIAAIAKTTTARAEQILDSLERQGLVRRADAGWRLAVSARS